MPAAGSSMRVSEALRWFVDGERIAWRSLISGTLARSGIGTAAKAFLRPLTAPSRYVEYELMLEQLRTMALDDPATWILDVGSPKLFPLLVAARHQATIVATDIWDVPIKEAAGLRGGLAPDAIERFRLGVADIREPLPAELLPPGGKYDGVFSMSVIEHVEPDPGGDRLALARMGEVARMGGTVVVSVPIDAAARSDMMRSDVYGREAAGTSLFFQRVYDSAALRALCASVADSMVLEACVMFGWPHEHLLLRLQPMFPTAIGVVGASFPWIADRFPIGEPVSNIPEITGPGDAILRFRKI
jgi:hypothetical protein